MAIRDDPSVRALEQRLAERDALNGHAHRDLTSAGLLTTLRDSVLHQNVALQQVARAVALGISGLGSRERGPLASLVDDVLMYPTEVPEGPDTFRLLELVTLTQISDRPFAEATSDAGGP